MLFKFFLCLYLYCPWTLRSEDWICCIFKRQTKLSQHHQQDFPLHALRGQICSGLEMVSIQSTFTSVLG